MQVTATGVYPAVTACPCNGRPAAANRDRRSGLRPFQMSERMSQLRRRLGLSGWLVPTLAAVASCSFGTSPAERPAVHINATNVVLSVGDTTSLGVTVDDRASRLHTQPTGFEPLLPESAGLEWTTDQPAIATVLRDGTLRAGAAGRAVVRARVGGASDSITAIVTTNPSNLTLEHVTAGANHTCGLTWAHDVVCWGDNWFGQVGTGVARQFTSIVSPVRAGLTAKARQVSAGTDHTCALDESGRLWCWGHNTFGQIWPGRSLAEPRPLLIPLSGSFVQVASGGDHSCALRPTGAVVCWGRESDHRSELRPSAGSFIVVSAGYDHTCAVDRDGAAWCWGRNDLGQLGVGDSESRSSPTRVATEMRFLMLSAGTRYTCGVSLDRRAYCWGHGVGGLLGDGTGRSTAVPTKVEGDLAFVSVDAGTDHTCGVTADGAAYCWGLNLRGQVGVGPVTDPDPTYDDLTHLMPARVVVPVSLRSIDVGAGQHSCAEAATDGSVLCWGDNGAGQLGIGNKGWYAGRQYSMRDAPAYVVRRPDIP